MVMDTEKEARRLVEKKRKVYYNRFVESLDMMISGNYAHIGKSGGKIVVKKDGKVVKEVFANKLSSLIINSHGTTISADAVRLCIENKVLINYFDDLGKPVAIVFAVASGANSVSTAQAFASKGEMGKTLVKQLVWAKITNQAALIKFITKNKKLEPDKKLFVDKSLQEMQELATKVRMVKTSENVENFRSRIFGFEGSAAVSYWNVIKLMIPEFYEFKIREHQNAQNMINQMFNYGYGILYSKILAASVLAGLNPNIPFLHSETKGKPALTFDMIEPFRPVIVDRTILSIISRSGKLESSGSKLSDDVRHRVSQKVIQRLYTEIEHRGVKLTLNDIIVQNAKDIATFLTGNTDSFKPYTMKW
jgi:CRISPR-associated protein Cas1